MGRRIVTLKFLNYANALGSMYAVYPTEMHTLVVRYYYDNGDGSIHMDLIRQGKDDDDITILEHADEEALFQLSCTVDYDVYYVHFLLHNLLKRIPEQHSDESFDNRDKEVMYDN